MIANPTVPAFRYDPYTKKLTRERYAHKEMREIRGEAIGTAKRSIDAFSNSNGVVEKRRDGMELPVWGVVLGTLGRQGSFKQLQVYLPIRALNYAVSNLASQAITTQLQSSPTPIPYIPILLSELSPAKLSLFNPHISTFVQTSCPRLSIDWGYAFDKPLLSVYECAVTVGKIRGWVEDSQSRGESAEDENVSGVYPMDFYEAGSLWSVARTTASL
jgi:2-(3-amino-3-carboxypropyl)histidine synthase